LSNAFAARAELAPRTRIEVLVSDFRGRLERALDILEAAPAGRG